MAYSKQIQQILDEADDLPSLPGVTQKVLSMSLREDVSLREIGDVITMDAALVMRFLKITNSAYYGFSSPINDIHQAVAILGGDTIRNIAITLSLIDVFPIKINGEYTTLFKRSLCAAVAAEFISSMGKQKIKADVFLAGMLQNLGMYILMRYLPDQYLGLIDQAKKYFVRIPVMEELVLGASNSVVGMVIAERWQLPDTVRLAIQYKDKPAMFEKSSAYSASMMELIHVTYLGGLVADIYFGWNKAWTSARFKNDMLLLLNYDERTSEDLLASIPHLIRDAGFSDFAGIGALPSYQDILKDAAEELRLSWSRSEDNFRELYELREKLRQKQDENRQLKNELEQSRQMVQKLARKLEAD